MANGCCVHSSQHGFLSLSLSRGVIDAGRAGINRARGRVSGHETSYDRWGSMKSSSSGSTNNPRFRRRRTGAGDDNDANATSRTERIQLGTDINDPLGDRHSGNEESIAGLLGLDDEFRIVGSQTNSEDEIRDVQLRALSRRILASPSLAFFPAKKVENDVM